MVFLLIFVTILILSLLPIFTDPYHVGPNVSFWIWMGREIYELIYGEVG